MGDEGRGRRVVLPVLSGLAVGVAFYWLLAIWPVVAMRLPSDFVVHPLTLVVYAVVSGVSVVVGSRWPLVGLTAGALILVAVIYAVAIGVGPVQLTSPWDVPSIVAYGGASVIPVMIGTVLLYSAALRLNRGASGRPGPGPGARDAA